MNDAEIFDCAVTVAVKVTQYTPRKDWPAKIARLIRHLESIRDTFDRVQRAELTPKPKP